MTEVSTLSAPAGGAQTTDVVPLVRPAVGSQVATPYALTLISWPLITLVGSTVDTTPTTLSANLNTLILPSSICAFRYSGHCKAMNPASGHYATWDIAASVKRSVLWQNPTLDFNTVVVLYADSDMAACSLVANVNSDGLALVGIGLAGTALNWNASLLVS
jgi:hypothetical protein